jgi:hypothetical protein
MSTSEFDKKYNDGKPIETKTVELQPHKGRAVGMGVYNAKDAEPDFELSFSTDYEEEIGVAHDRLTVGGSRYLLLYQFHNFGSKPCTVTLTRRRHKPTKREA